jgi:hypothetical protein
MPSPELPILVQSHALTKPVKQNFGIAGRNSNRQRSEFYNHKDDRSSPAPRLARFQTIPAQFSNSLSKLIPGASTLSHRRQRSTIFVTDVVDDDCRLEHLPRTDARRSRCAFKQLPGKRADLATGGNAEEFTLVTIVPSALRSWSRYSCTMLGRRRP